MDMEKVIREIEDALSDDMTKAGYIYRLSLVGLKDKALTDALALLKEQEKRINELEEKLRLLEYGDQDTLQSVMMPAT